MTVKTFIQRVVSGKIDLRYTRLIFRDPLTDVGLISFQPEVSYPLISGKIDLEYDKFFLKDIEQLEDRVWFTLWNGGHRKVSFYIENSDICSVSLSPVVPSRGWIHGSNLMHLYFYLYETGMGMVEDVFDLIKTEVTQDE